MTVLKASMVYVLEYGLQTGSMASDLVGFKRMADGRIGTDFSFCVRSAKGSGDDWRRIDNVKLPWVTVKGGGDSPLVSGTSFLIST
jgi:hypothetical protein